MRRHELRVEQPVAAEPQPRHEMDQRDLAGIGDPAEHALAEECRAERDPVEPADKFAVVPAFDAVRRAAARTAPVYSRTISSLIHVVGRVSLASAQPRITAVEGGVAAHLETAAPQHALQPARHMEPSSGMIPRRFGSTQNSSGSSADSAIGKMPAA